MKHQEPKGSLYLVLATLLWGFAFVFQKEGGVIGTLSFMTGRFCIGSAALLCIALFRNVRLRRAGKGTVFTKFSAGGGIVCGLFYFAACYAQQRGMITLEAGVSGFLTATYTIMVPFMALALGQKVRPLNILGAFLCLAGLFFLCMGGSARFAGFGAGEVLTLISAVFWAFQILAIDHYSSKADPVALCLFQTLTGAALSAIGMAVLEKPSAADFITVLPSLLYVGIASTAIAFTLQIVGQKYTPPTKATILMSLESVFSVLGGWLFLHEALQPRQYLGCAFIFAATILSQLPAGKTAARRTKQEDRS